MPEKLSRGARATLRQAVVIAYDVADDEYRVQVRRAADTEYSTPFWVERADLSSVLPPIQKPGARVIYAGAPHEVVLHDAESGHYVLRHALSRRIVTVADDASITPLSAQVKGLGGLPIDLTELEELEAPTPPPADFSALAKPVAAAPRETGPNCDHTFMDAVCDADGCLGEMPL